jgi:hypothetical protein
MISTDCSLTFSSHESLLKGAVHRIKMVKEKQPLFQSDCLGSVVNSSEFLHYETVKWKHIVHKLIRVNIYSELKM